MKDLVRKQPALAAACALALIAAVLGFVTPAGAAVAALAAAGAVVYTIAPRGPRATDPHLIQRLQSQAEQGRQLAIYERDTSLLAHWYVSLRGEEECARSMRYERAMTVVVIEPQSGGEEWAIKERLADWLHRQTRHTDLVGYLGNGRFVAILTETDAPQSHTLIARLSESVPPVEYGVASFPSDGANFATLLEHAQQALRGSAASSAARTSSAAEPAA